MHTRTTLRDTPARKQGRRAIRFKWEITGQEPRAVAGVVDKRTGKLPVGG